ncbi:putative Acyl CoA binding protein [Leishmania naiffi]|uniref:Acyl CoA binding protein n=1 Tax=Leishmania naiffi TaxID=5678 RepID=A0AAW3C0P3_9TRYP
MFARFFWRRAKPELKVVCDAESIVYPVDFDAPDYPYEQAFKEADAYVRKLPIQGVIPISDIVRLQFYSLFKQATEGDISEKDVKQPSILRDWERYWKVYGWRKCRGMTREKARDRYIDLLDLQIRKHCSFVWGAPASEDRWAAFHDGVRIIRNLPKGGYRLPESLRAHFYALYKQAHVGDLSDFQKTPGALSGKYKWLRSRPLKVGFDQMRYDEWAALKGMSPEKAKRMYCKDIFKNAAMCGYVWAPPGTDDHLEVIGDQTSAKTLKKRADADKDAERIAAATHLSIEETINAAGLQLSMIERLTMHSFLKEEKQAAAAKAASSAARRRRQEESERKHRGAAGSHADPNTGVASARPNAEESSEEIAAEATEADVKAEGEARLESQGTGSDFQSVCSLCGSIEKDVPTDAAAPEGEKMSGTPAVATKFGTGVSTSRAPVVKLEAPAQAKGAPKPSLLERQPTAKERPVTKGAAPSFQAKNGAKRDAAKENEG